MRPLLVLSLFTLIVVPSAGAWTWPAGGPVLVAYSFDPAHPYAAGQHRGIDVGGSEGESVEAPASGVVSFAGTVPGNGKTVTVLTPDGWAVTLTQLGSITVSRGSPITEGQIVGTVGPTGDREAEGAYVQLGIRHATYDERSYRVFERASA